MDIFCKEMLYAEGKEQTFVRPNLTANGTLGGSAFAVGGTQNYSNRPLYYAVDSSNSTFWRSDTSESYYIIYNPKALKVTQFLLYYTNAQYSPSTNANYLLVSGSNNNSSWNAISKTISQSSNYITLTLSNSVFYKYYVLILRPAYSGYEVRLTNLVITATYKG